MGEWIMETITGEYIDMDPFPHSLLSTRQKSPRRSPFRVEPSLHRTARFEDIAEGQSTFRLLGLGFRVSGLGPGVYLEDQV